MMSATIAALRPETGSAGWRYPSLFWPPVFVCIGAMTLLWNQDVLTPASMTVFTRLWPLLLIGAGLDVLVARSRPVLSGALGIGVVAFALALAFAGPAAGLAGDFKTYHFSEPVGQATSAQIAISTRAGHLHVDTLTDSRRLVTAEVTDATMPDFTASGQTQKMITIGHPEESSSTGYFDEISRQAHIQITRTVPIALDVQLGAGLTTLDLQQARLTRLQVADGSGRVDLRLPALQGMAPVNLSSGSGTMHVQVPAAASLNLTASLGSGRVSLDIGSGADVVGQLISGSGTLDVHLAHGTALRLTVPSQVQRLDLPSGLHRVSGPADDDRQGVWESPGFAQASHQVDLTLTLGSGALLVTE